METEERKTKKIAKINVKKNSATYIRQRQKANARKQKYLNNLTSEQRELKRAKDREYYQKKKATNKSKCINDMTEREKRKQRALWKKNSKNYRQNKKKIINIVNNTPLLGKERAKAYRTISIQNSKIKLMQMEIDSLKKQLERQKRQEIKLKADSLNEASPNSKVNNLIRNCNVVADVREGRRRKKNNSRNSIYHEVYSLLSSSSDEDLITLRRKKEQEPDMDAGTSNANDFKEIIHPNKISPGVFLLIYVPTNRKNTGYRYVAIAETCVDEEGEIKVTFLKSLRNNARDFKVDYNDVSYVTYEQVIKIIPKPESIEGASPFYHFHNDMDIFEKF